MTGEKEKERERKKTEREIETNNVIGKRAAHVNEWRTPPKTRP